MSNAERLVLDAQLRDHRARIRDLTDGLRAVRDTATPDRDHVDHITSAQILQLRIKIALLESQLAA
jgi:hypothetical protein